MPGLCDRTLRARRLTQQAGSLVTAVVMTGIACAADVAGSGRTALGAGVQSLTFPSVGRVIAGFLVTVFLMVGIAWTLRRVGPWVRREGAVPAGVRVMGRSTLSNTLAVHIVEIDGVRLAVAEGRSGVAIAALTPSSTSSSVSSSPNS